MCRCAGLKQELLKATTNKERDEINERKARHRKLVNEERQTVHDRMFAAKNEPKKYLYLEMDSMDQDKTSIPHFPQPPKDFKDTGKVKTHVTCVRVPSLNKVYEYLYTNNLAHDANTTVTLLDKALGAIANDQGFLPPILYLQLDNTCRENKNVTMLGYLSLLVKLGVFKKVYLGFLPVGHTHFGCDQVFSRHSTKLNKKEAPCGDTLVALLMESYTPTPEMGLIVSAADVSCWLQPHLHKQFQGHTDSYQFLLQMQDDKVMVRDKLYSVITEYQEGAQLLLSIPQGLPTHAGRRHLYFTHPKHISRVDKNGNPLSDEHRAQLQQQERNTCITRAEAGMEALKSNIKMLRELKMLSSEQLSWWEGFIQFQETTDWSARGQFRYLG